MAKAFAEWTVLNHGELVQVQENLWLIEGEIPKMSLRRRMTVARQDNGALLMHNPIALDEETIAQVEALGPVFYIIVPNGWHRLDAPSFRKRYPETIVLCPWGALKKVEQVVEVGGSYNEFPDDEKISLQHLRGMNEAEGVLKVSDGTQSTLIFNDILFNLPKGAGGLMMKIMGSTGGPKVTPMMRMIVIKNKKELRAHLEELAQTPGLCRIVPGHGDVIEEGAAGVLRDVAATL